MHSIPIEFVVQDAEGVRITSAAGADRIELCSALPLGGLTPSAGLIWNAVSAAPTNFVHVLIRPRPGGFIYSPAEITAMCADIQLACDFGAAGVVVGSLTADLSIDTDALAAFIAAADPLPLTFHRAFDVTERPLEALDVLIEHGVSRVLTSGQKATAPEGAALLAELVTHAAGRVEIMAGGGVTVGSIPQLKAAGVQAVHLSAKTVRSAGPAGPGGGAEEFDCTDPGLVAQAVQVAHRAG